MDEIGDIEFKRRRHQQMQSLRRAAAARKARAELRRAMREGEIDPYGLIRGEYPEHEEVVVKWRIDQLINAVPGIGPATAQEIFEMMPVSPTQRLHSLSNERRDRLAKLCAAGARVRSAPGETLGT